MGVFFHPNGLFIREIPIYKWMINIADYKGLKTSPTIAATNHSPQRPTIFSELHSPWS